MSEADYITHFRKSFEALQGFYTRWLTRIQERCQSNSQREAAFYLWSRYSMSIRTMEALLNPALLPDILVICRGCLEFDVYLEAVMKDAKIAAEYLEFGKHARARYVRLVAQQGDVENHLKLREKFEEQYEEDIEGLGKSDSWCKSHGGITGLMKELKRDIDVRGYAMLCHFTHGSVWAMETLNGNIRDPDASLERALKSFFGHYLETTRKFVTFIWEPLLTPEGEACKEDILRIDAEYILGAK